MGQDRDRHDSADGLRDLKGKANRDAVEKAVPGETARPKGAVQRRPGDFPVLVFGRAAEIEDNSIQDEVDQESKCRP